MELLENIQIFDAALITIVVISIVLGLIRGAIREILSLVGLAIAVYLAFEFSEKLSTEYVNQVFETEHISYIVSFVLIIVVTIFMVALINLLFSQLLKASGLSFLNRILGMLFGLIRGVTISSILVLVIGLVPTFTNQKWWQTSNLSSSFKQIAEAALQYLPNEIAGYFDSRTLENKITTIDNIINSNRSSQKNNRSIKSELENLSTSQGKNISEQGKQQILESISSDAIQLESSSSYEQTTN